MKENKLKMEI